MTHNQLKAIKNAINYNLTQIDNIRQLVAPLKKIGLNDFFYSKIEKNIRVVQLYSCAKYVNSYKHNLYRFPRQDFLESNLSVISLNINDWILFPFIVKNYSENTIIKHEIECSVGFKIIYSMVDPVNDILENYGFIIDMNKSHQLEQVLNNKNMLESYIFYFIDKAKKMIKEAYEKNNKLLSKKNI